MEEQGVPSTLTPSSPFIKDAHEIEQGGRDQKEPVSTGSSNVRLHRILKFWLIT